MKKILTVLAIALVIVGCKKETPSDAVKENPNYGQGPVRPDMQGKKFVNPETAPVLSFEKYVHDFGNLAYAKGGKVSHNFKFTNIGKGSLIIENVKASCGCTVPSPPKEPFAPGESGEILVEFSPKNHNGTQGSSVTVKSNTVKGTDILRIAANVSGADARPKTPQPNMTPAPTKS